MRNCCNLSIQLTDPFKAKNVRWENVFIITNLKYGWFIDHGIFKDSLYLGQSADLSWDKWTVLEHGIGHLAASSFPIGGKDTHAVLTGHTGLSSAKIFTDLTEMKKGDFFFIHVLDKKLAYRVDQITRDQTTRYKELQIMDGKDHVTLLTCTPYGVNDHAFISTRNSHELSCKREELRQEDRIIPSGWKFTDGPS